MKQLTVYIYELDNYNLHTYKRLVYKNEESNLLQEFFPLAEAYSILREIAIEKNIDISDVSSDIWIKHLKFGEPFYHYVFRFNPFGSGYLVSRLPVEESADIKLIKKAQVPIFSIPYYSDEEEK